MINMWDKVLKTEQCWYWLGYTGKWGPELKLDGNKVSRIHRVIFLQANPDVDPKKRLQRLCSTKSCVNPTHYRLEGLKYADAISKTCSACKQEKPVSEFYKMRARYHPKCKPCHIAYVKKWYREEIKPLIEEGKREKLRLRESQASS